MRSGEPVFLLREVVLLAHTEGLAEHGGASGLRDEGLLDSALARPLNLLAYGEPDLADLAAAYAYGIARNHPFVDGNKRTSLIAARLFLLRNGYRLRSSEAERIATWIALAAGEVTEEALAAWIRDRLVASQAG